MKVVQIIQKNHAIVGISPNQTQPVNGRVLITLLLHVSGFTFSAMYLIYEANNFLEYANVMFITTGLAMMILVLIINILKMTELFQFIDNMEKMVNRALDLSSKAIYERNIHLIEKCCKIGYILTAQVTPFCWIYPKVILSYFIYFSSNVDNEAFDLPVLMWFPFDWKNPIGYFIATTWQYFIFMTLLLFDAGVVFLGISAFLLAVAGTKCCKINLKSIHERGVYAENLSWTVTQFAHFMEVHSDLKQLVHEFLDVYQPQFMVLSTWSLAAICGVMLMIQIQIQEFISLAVLLLTIAYACYAFGVVLIICELGQRLSEAFEEINDTIDEFDWYLFPPQIQRMLPIIMISTQQEVELECFGSIAGTRETFKKVVNSGISYFMMMRQFMN